MKFTGLQLGLLFLGLFLNVAGLACDDAEADDVIAERAIVLAKRYQAKNVGIGASIVYGNMRSTNIVILQGTWSPGETIDRIGSIAINMTTCRVMNSLVSVYDVLEVD